jgi:hypothetical protein
MVGNGVKPNWWITRAVSRTITWSARDVVIVATTFGLYTVEQR